MPQRTTPITIAFPDREVEALETWRKSHKIMPSRSEAARVMLAHGLKALARGMPLENEG